MMSTEKYKSKIKTIGYSDKFSVRAGERINFMVSSETPKFTASIEKIISGMTDPEKQDLETIPVKAECNGVYPGHKQVINIGSYAELPFARNWLKEGEFSVSLYIWPTIVEGKNQTIFSGIFEDKFSRMLLFINEEGFLEFQVVDGNGKQEIVASKTRLRENEWYFITVGYSKETKQLFLYKNCIGGWKRSYDIEKQIKIKRLDFVNSLVEKVIMAARETQEGDYKRENHYNGKIENPRFYKRALSQAEVEMNKWMEPSKKSLDHKLIANYDFSKAISSDKLEDVSGNDFHGKVYQRPTRGVTGHNWTGNENNYQYAPQEYGAIHFHEDDLENAEWEVSVSWKVPGNIKSGVYSLKLDDGGGELDYIPFYVRPKKGEENAPILFLAPTNTYLAYANELLSVNSDLDEFIMDHELKLAPQDEYILANPEVGKSQYDLHNDGSGVIYSSRLRPIMNIRPHYRNWITGTVRHFNADLFITGWLEKRKRNYNVATDEDLHNEGIELLKNYKVIITGSHPEYWTREMMESLEEYLANGGKIMYLGGNGFYWVTSLDSHKKYVTEVRRGNSGTRAWNSPPGEIYHSMTGEHGGLWRYNGYVPQELVGVGFTTQGFSRGSGYKRLEDSYTPKAKFIFEGIGEEEIIGDFGYILDGAAGDELDRYDTSLGTPKHALRLATTTGFDNHYQYVIEEQLMASPRQGGEDNDLVRSDITYFEIEGGGEVFSVGSIAWAGSLAWNNYDNNVAKISDNVLKKFIEG